MAEQSGRPWSEVDVEDLTYSITHGDTIAQAARFLRSREDEVRDKMKDLGLVEQPRKRVRARSPRLVFRSVS